MKNLSLQNKFIFAATFITTLAFCTWLVLKVGSVL